MSSVAIILTLCGYLALLFVVARRAARRGDNATFFTGGRTTPRLVASIAMVGAAMSGVTYISVPGSVLTDGFSYLQTCLGFFVGYAVIAFVLIILALIHNTGKKMKTAAEPIADDPEAVEEATEESSPEETNE